MKKIAIAVVSIAIAFVSMSFISNDYSPIKKSNKLVLDKQNIDAKTIIDNKCYGCHNSESKNKKGKKKLSFDSLDKLSIYKQIGKYEGIHEVITEGDMPPKKFIAKYPNKALSTKEKEVLVAWAKAKGEELSK